MPPFVATFTATLDCRGPATVHLRRRGGIYLNRSRRSIWVHAADPGDFAAAEALVRWLRTATATDRLLFTSGSPRTCAWLAARYPNDNVLPPPWDLPPLVGRFLRQLRPVLIVCIGNVAPLPAGLLRRARGAGIPVARVDAADTGCRQAIAALAPLVAGLPPPGGMSDRTAPRRMDRLARSRLGRLVVATRRGRAYASLEALAQRLGHPQTILCLGNGPSSEDPCLRGLAHDALFRVNWRWVDRGLLTRPDMVFVGDMRTMARVRGCVFGFRTLAWEAEMLLRQLVLDRRWRAPEHFTYARVSPLLDDAAWAAHPTNGAVMVATAAALRPRRLVLSGIDLYLDPRGRYPGDTVADNDFPQMHSREVELAILARVLAGYPGELWVVNEPLRDALAARGVHGSPVPAAGLP